MIVILLYGIFELVYTIPTNIILQSHEITNLHVVITFVNHMAFIISKSMHSIIEFVNNVSININLMWTGKITVNAINLCAFVIPKAFYMFYKLSKVGDAFCYRFATLNIRSIKS